MRRAGAGRRLGAAATRFGAALFGAVLFAAPARAQTDGVLQVDGELQRFLFRQQTRGLLPDAFLDTQPLAAHVARGYLDELRSALDDLAQRDREILSRLTGESPGPLTLGLRSRIPFLYENGVDLYSLSGDGYRVQVNPLADLSYGRDFRSGDERSSVWRSTRGVRASGSFAEAVFFEARVEENQWKTHDTRPDPERKTAPRIGKTNYDEDRKVLDYLIATGLVGYRSRFFEVRFGRDRNRWGSALGGVALSNFGTVYDQLQIRTTFGPVQYTNLFMSLTTGRITRSDGYVPKKYAAMHRLVVKLPHRVELSLQESVVFATDSLGARKSFDVAYLNPVIFLRAVEADRGSPDNVLLGASASWVAVPGYRIYGSLFLDELRVSEIGKRWWANKWATQVGLHAVPIPEVDVRVEYTRIRPYTYAHREPLNAYVHFDDVLGHPAGPNAVDWLFAVNARPASRLEVSVAAWRTIRGRDTTGVNFGSDPRLPNGTRVSDADVSILQGVREVATSVDALVAYELLPRLFIDARFRYGARDDEVDGLTRYVQPTLGIRWGLTASSERY